MYANVIFVTLSLNNHVDDRYVFKLDIACCGFQKGWNKGGETLSIICKTILTVMWCHLPTIGLLKQHVQPSDHEMRARMCPDSVRVFILEARYNIIMYMHKVLKKCVDSWIHVLWRHNVGGYVFGKMSKF